MVLVPRLSGDYGGTGSRCAPLSWLRSGRHPTSRPSRIWPFRAILCTGLSGAAGRVASPSDPKHAARGSKGYVCAVGGRRHGVTLRCLWDAGSR